MFVSEPFIRFESPAVAPVFVPAGIRSLIAVLMVAIVLFVAMLVATPSIVRLCTPSRAGTPVHLAR